MAEMEMVMLGKRIAQLRQERGLSQSELARRTGYTPQAINQWERGKRQPTLISCQKIAAVLQVDPVELLKLAVEGIAA